MRQHAGVVVPHTSLPAEITLIWGNRGLIPFEGYWDFLKNI
jgi:hypothetical protein